MRSRRRPWCASAPWLFAIPFIALEIAAPSLAAASCKTPLPDASLRALDASADTDPLRVVETARAQRAATTDPFRRAQLDAIVADAFDTTSDDAAARQAVEDARAELRRVAPGPEVDGVALRLALVEADTSQTPAEIAEALRTLYGLERRIEDESLGHACLLLVRGRVLARTAQFELAAKDGLRSYQLATALNATDARSEAAFQLATTYRRAGLHEEALAMLDEVIAYTRANRQTAGLASALWQRGNVLLDAGRAAQALSVLVESRALSVQLGDQPSLAFADYALCQVHHALERIDDAERACTAAAAGFRAADRIDQLSGVYHRLGLIALEGGRVPEALARFDAALARGESAVPPLYLPRIHRDRAEALRRAGRAAEALTALRRYVELHEAADDSRQSRAVAVLNAQRATAESESARHELARQLQFERERAQSRELQQRLSTWLGVGGALVAILLGYLLLMSRRHARALRRQEAILRATSDNAPDALVLLDARGRVLFANRAPFRHSAVPAPERPIADCVPAEARAAVERAVAELVEQRHAVAFDLSVGAGEDERRYEVRGLPIVEDGQLIGATLRAGDVTERRELERQVIEVAARERDRFSMDLHEGLGQELTGVALQLQALARALEQGKGTDARVRVADAIAQVSSAIATTRDLARGLSPVQIERGSLSLALQRLAADAARRLRVAIATTSDPPDIQMPEPSSDHLYRIAVEAVTDAARHRGCTRIEIALRETPAAWVLSVSDDGRGMPPDTESGDGLGLRMMAYRARLAGGELALERSTERGMRVVVTVPRASGTRPAGE